jgi:hypothetical protein
MVMDANRCSQKLQELSSKKANDQAWAMYDEEDGMPRYYALIRKVISTRPFKVRLVHLKANDSNEFGVSSWLSCGYSKTCGEFKVDVFKFDASLFSVSV